MNAPAQASSGDQVAGPTLKGTGAAAEELRAAALAELLGQINAVQRSQKALVDLQEDLDKRLTGSISALRKEIKRTQELLAARDTLVGEMAVRAAEQSRREFLRAAADAQILRDPQVPRAPIPVWQAVLATAAVLLCLSAFGFGVLAASRHLPF